MKTPARLSFLTAVPLLWALTWAAVAQETPAPTPADNPPPAAAPAEPATPPAPESDAPMRRLDEPSPAAPEAAPAVPESAQSAADAAAQEAEKADEAAAAADTAVEESHRSHRRHHRGGNERVAFWQNAELAAGESAGAVVSVIGSSTSAGDVGDAVVSVLGSSTSSGTVGGAVVSVAGSSRVTAGRVGDAVVSIIGNSYVNAEVHGDVVAVLGNVELGPDAEVHGQLVCVGGRVTRSEGAVVNGQTNQISFGFNFGGFEWLHAWIAKCLLYGRPLAFSTSVMWAWWLALGFFVVYLGLGLLFPGAITKSAETLEQRPGFSILTAFLVTLLTPAAAILLAVTVVGTPALLVCLFVATIFGKAAMLAWLGRRITKLFGDSPLAHPFFAVLIGGLILLLLYTVPVVGFVVQKLTSWLGVGVVVYALILGIQRNRAPAQTVATVGVTPGAAEMAAVAADPLSPSAGPLTGTATATASSPPLTMTPARVSASTLPRAGFWLRIAASLIDGLIVLFAVNLFPHPWEPSFLLTFALYCVVLWGLKATTIGGIVCSLKIVRIDDRAVDWPTALVRALGGFVALVPAGLGFVWVAFDQQRQGWHDKIAGTTIVRVPRGVSLV